MPPSITPRYSKDPTHRYGILTPRFWHGMRFGTWLKLLMKHNCRLTPRNMITAATITPCSIFNSVAGGFQSLLYGRKIRRQTLSAPPLFVLGHWRSGTTLLHEFLICDPEHTFPSTYECFAPQHFLFTRRWIAPLTSWLLPKHRPMDNVPLGWDRPQEDEFALINLGLPSPYLCWVFPHDGPVHSDYLTLRDVPKRQRRRWQSTLKMFVKAIAVHKNKRIVLKSPPHTARVKSLLEIFPNAKFVHIARHPLKLYPSTVRLWKTLADVQGLQPDLEEYDWIEEEVLQNLEQMYAAYEEDRDLIPAGNLSEIRYEDLVENPRDTMRSVYDTLALGDFARIEPGIDKYLEDSSEYQTNRFSLPADVEQKVAERWAGYFVRYGYQAISI